MERTEQCAGAKSALEMIGGKWKPPILFLLSQRGTIRFNELLRSIPNVTQKILTENLRELEEHGLVTRRVYPEVPPRVEYALTEYGRSAVPIVNSLQQWGSMHRSNREAK
ncbi:helix-turn-helix domain-containing protein [Paenibacillus sp.]|uniref:winged helix-turn-helix transcriptional regulator n=1 Tax=Paenibacillus sp. TaxID=58172 RepID=UPI002D4AF85D|nr:helix-turn-helix domain-containing protein [Paenibacillus sp.]HZG86394.1 helix-turn-helix domain-containing protein [Paenibacillus sp.]